MGKKSHRKRIGVVYSTDPDYLYQSEPDEDQTLDKSDQRLRVRIEKKGRGGKTVTIVTGFHGSTDDLKSLAKELKSYCGTGGSVKDGEIIVQGDNKQKVIHYLRKSGYPDTK